MKNDQIHFIPNVASTNDLLSEIAQRSWAEGTPLPSLYTLYTDFQTAGHGMGGNRWFSDRNENLLVSFYFEPGIPAARQFDFNQFFAVATRDFLARHVGRVQIKWPNDLYIGGRKVAGDLTAHTLRGTTLCYSIAGIGINLNQKQFPSDIPHPTSLFLETGETYNIERFLEEYWKALHDNLPRLHQPEWLKMRYMEHLFRLEEWHEYQIHGIRREARIVDTDVFGRLLLEDRQGATHRCGFKEIVFL